MTIVGARCAGSPLATMLAQRGMRVCLLDKSRFPSETLSTHVIQPCGVAVLDRIGVLDQVLAAGAARLSRFTFVSEGARMEAVLDDEPFGHPSISLRRVELDRILVERAAASGVHVRTGVRVTGLLAERGRVAGVVAGGEQLRSRLVVGADGRKSTVAGLTGSRKYCLASPQRLFAWAYFEGVEADGHLRIAAHGDLTYVAGPTDAGLYLAAACPPIARRGRFLAEREGEFETALRAWPELAGILSGARRTGPVRVMAEWHGYFREPVGPGWALLGDAGNFKDPSPAQGMADALRHGERLAEAIASGINGGDLDGELRRWGRWRDRDGREMHWFAADMGSARSARPLADQILRDISAGEQDTRLFLRMLNHEVEPSRLFTARRIASAALRVAWQRPPEIAAMLKEGVGELKKVLGRAMQRPPGSATERVLLVLTVIGFVVPNVFVGLYLADSGMDLGGYLPLWTASIPSTQLLFDLAIAAIAFLYWAAVEGRRRPVERWWVCIPATFLVGICFGLPLFLWMRERALWKHAPSRA